MKSKQVNGEEKGYEVKLFISWAKDTAREIALSFYEWLPEITLGKVKTWCSASNSCCPQGQGFSKLILDAAEDCDACLVIITRESISGWWTNFESGLFFGKGKKVFAILCGDLTYQQLAFHNHPLSVNGVNYTEMTEESITNFLKSLKFNDPDWEKINFGRHVSQNFSVLKEKYDSIFTPAYVNMSSKLSKKDSS